MKYYEYSHKNHDRFLCDIPTTNECIWIQWIYMSLRTCVIWVVLCACWTSLSDVYFQSQVTRQQVLQGKQETFHGMDQHFSQSTIWLQSITINVIHIHGHDTHLRSQVTHLTFGKDKKQLISIGGFLASAYFSSSYMNMDSFDMWNSAHEVCRSWTRVSCQHMNWR